MADLKDNITFTLKDVKNFLKVEHDKDDNLITGLINGACDDAQSFLHKGYTGSDIPDAVNTWLKKTIARHYEQRVRGLKNSKYGDESVNFDEEDPYKSIRIYQKKVGL